jgi:uncharacterized membrane protein
VQFITYLIAIANDLATWGISEALWVFLISASPIVELRGAIPLAIKTYDIPWPWSLLTSYIGNLLPVPFLLLLLEPIAKLLSRIKIFEKIIDWLFERTRRRGILIERYKKIGLTLFVAIPAPVTGAWTGSVAAFLFGIKFKHAFICIAVGVFIAGVIVTTLTLLGWWGAIIAGVGLAALAVLGIWRI